MADLESKIQAAYIKKIEYQLAPLQSKIDDIDKDRQSRINYWEEKIKEVETDKYSDKDYRYKPYQASVQDVMYGTKGLGWWKTQNGFDYAVRLYIIANQFIGGYYQKVHWNKEIIDNYITDVLLPKDEQVWDNIIKFMQESKRYASKWNGEMRLAIQTEINILNEAKTRSYPHSFTDGLSASHLENIDIVVECTYGGFGINTQAFVECFNKKLYDRNTTNTNITPGDGGGGKAAGGSAVNPWSLPSPGAVFIPPGSTFESVDQTKSRNFAPVTPSGSAGGSDTFVETLSGYKWDGKQWALTPGWTPGWDLGIGYVPLYDEKPEWNGRLPGIGYVPLYDGKKWNGPPIMGYVPPTMPPIIAKGWLPGGGIVDSGVHDYVSPGAVVIPPNWYYPKPKFPFQEPKTPVSIPNPIESGIIPPSTGVTPIKIPFNTEGNEGWQNVPPSGTTQTSGIIPDNPSSGINQNQEPFDAIWGMAGIGNDPLTPENKPAIWWNPVPWSSDVPATPAEKYLVDHIILDIQYRAFKLQKQINLSKIAPSFNSIPALNLKDLDDQYRAAIEAKQVIRSFKIFISSISPELKQKMYEVPPDKIKLNLADGKSYYQSIGDWKEWYAFKAKYENQT